MPLSPKAPITPKPPGSEVPQEQTPAFLERLARIGKMIRGTHESIRSLVDGNPVMKAKQWVESKLKQFAPFLFSDKKSEIIATPPVQPPVAPLASSTPERLEASHFSRPEKAEQVAPAETKTASELSQRANEAEYKKMSLIMGDFERISQQLRPDMQRTLDSLALQRMKDMKETRVLSHDKRKGPENILSGNYDSAEAIAKKFMTSPDHRPNMLGSYKNFGLAMDRVFAKEKNEKTGQIEEKWQYFFVVVFNDGAEAKPLPPVVDPIPSVPNSAASVDTFFPAFAALEESAKEAGLEISHEPNDELAKKWVSTEEQTKGTAVETFQTSDGKKVNYIVRKNPPTLTQLGDHGPMSNEMLFSEFVEHFKKAIEVPTAKELQQQMNKPSAPEVTYGMEGSHAEEEQAIVNPS